MPIVITRKFNNSGKSYLKTKTNYWIMNFNNILLDLLNNWKILVQFEKDLDRVGSLNYPVFYPKKVIRVLPTNPFLPSPPPPLPGPYSLWQRLYNSHKGFSFPLLSPAFSPLPILEIGLIYIFPCPIFILFLVFFSDFLLNAKC